ncbi:DUF3310 domain-containing protein [Listeria booriae]|uniref:DUF3310 domain-containing protein n=1 Tax=Listeria booriae TaxID=1552123 RepID=UPI0035E0AC66
MENVIVFMFGITFGGILATSIFSWVPYFKKEKSVINHIFDEYHELEDLNLSNRKDYDKYMSNKGYYVKSENETSITYQNAYGIDYMTISKTGFEDKDLYGISTDEAFECQKKIGAVFARAHKEEPKMKIYHTETQEDFDALMVELEELGVVWYGGTKPTSDFIRCHFDKVNTCIFVENNQITKAPFSHARETYPDVAVIKYKANDNVNNPNHYTAGGIETLDYIKAKVNDYPSYVVGNIIKYITRYEHKNGLEDLKKAQFYLDDLIEWMEEK